MTGRASNASSLSAHMQIGLQPVGTLLDRKAQRMLRSRLDEIADIGAERHDLIVSLARDIHLDGDEGGVLDADAELFDRA